VSFQDKLVPQAKFAALTVHSLHLFLLLGILLLGQLLLEFFLLCSGYSRDSQVEILTQPVQNMECKFVNPDPLVKETDPRESQRYGSERPDPDPKRHGSAKKKKLIATSRKDERVIRLTEEWVWEDGRKKYNETGRIVMRILLTKNNSVADPGSRIQLFSIPDPNCLHPGSWIRIEEFKYLNPKITKKMVSKL
jgi:hypothetical protein